MLTFSKELVRKVLWALGYEIRRRVDLVDFLLARRVDLVLDVGANTGQFARKLRARGYKSEIISFEPASEPFKELERSAASDPNWQVRNAALGSQPGEATINIAENSVYNSFRDRTAVASAFDTRSAAVKQERVEVTTVDEVLANKRDRRIFLKIDTQGYEREILAGAGKSLPFILGILLEIPIVHLYEQTWTLQEVLCYLNGLGFVPAQITPTNHLRQLDPVSLAEIDCVFRRMDEKLDGVRLIPEAIAETAPAPASLLKSTG